jgi:alpha-beta hydrolase superfamily lysophospholipase
MRFSETRLDILQTDDHLELDIHIWEPENPEVVLMAIHGGLAHAGDYVTPALFFKDKSMATVAYDLRGHKQPQVYIDRFDQFISDTARFSDWVKHQYPGLPVIYMGHSVGALIGTLFGLGPAGNDPAIKGYVFSSPYYENAIKVNPAVIPMLRIISRIFPKLSIPGPDITDLLTHDAAITARHRQDANDHLRSDKASVRFGAELLAAQDRVKQIIQNWPHPLLAVVAGDDHVADASTTHRLLDQINPSLLTRITLPGNFHENFNEINREDTFARIYDWITARLNRDQ